LKALIFCVVVLLISLALIDEAHASLVFSIYQDPFCTVPASAIYWGSTLVPAQSYTQNIYVRNDGSEEITAFTVAMANTAPPNAINYLTLAVGIAPNQTAILPLEPQGVIELTLTLAIAPDAPQGSFSFNIVLTASSTTNDAGGGGGSGSYSQSLPMATTTPAASDSPNLNGFLFLVVIGVAVFLLIGGKKR